MKKNLKKLHPSKAWVLLYPLYARHFLFGSDYGEFIALIKTEFELTPEQERSIRLEWEIKEQILG
jgi:hypothetical protein